MKMSTLLVKWREVQSQYDYPVDASGEKIDPSDSITNMVWREWGIDFHMKKKTTRESVDS